MADEQTYLVFAWTPGGYELRLWLDGGRMEKIGQWISAASAALLLLTITVPTRNGQKV